MPLGLVDTPPVLNDSKMRYDFNEVIGCVHTATGKVLWARQTAGRWSRAVDPQTDDLYLWRDSRPYVPPWVFRLKAATGEVVLDRTLAVPPERLRGLLLHGLPLVERNDGFTDDLDPAATVYDATADKVEKVDYHLRLWLSPDEKKRLVITRTYTPPTRTLSSAGCWTGARCGNMRPSAIRRVRRSGTRRT